MIILPEPVLEAINRLEADGFDAYVVGACLRELIIGNSPQDFDIVTNAEINDILYAFREYRISDEGLPRGEILVTIVGMVIQVSPFRREVVGNRVMYAADLETDLYRRGFAMNTMAYSPKKGLIDPYGGKNCLSGEIKRVVAVGETVTRAVRQGTKSVTESYYDMSRCFTTDPTRLLTAIRYCAEDEYEIEEQTLNAMRANVSCFEYADMNKLREELTRIVMGKYAARALDNHGDILKHIIPEIEPCIDLGQRSREHDFSVWTHTAKSVGFAPPEPVLRYAMLFHDLGKPDCMYIDSKNRGHFRGHGERGRLLAEGIMKRLGFDKEMSEEISWLVYHHDVEIPEDRKALKGLINDLGAPDLRKLLQCEIANSRAKKLSPDESKLSETDETKRLRASLTALDEIINNGECYNISQLAVTKRELIERKLVTTDKEAEQLLLALFDIVLDKPSFNNKLMLLDIAEKSKSKLEKLEAEREAKLREQRERERREKEPRPRRRRRL